MDISQIQKRIETIEKLQRENRELKEIMKGELENDQRFVEAFEEAKEASTKKKRLKEEIENGGSNKEMLATIKDNNEELSTLKEILSAELMQIYTEQKSDQISDAEGNVRKFKVSAKILGKNSNYDDRDQMGKYTKDENPGG